MDLRLALTLVTIGGGLLTLIGLIRAYLGARENVAKRRLRIERARELNREEAEESEAMYARGTTTEESLALIARYRALHAENGSERPPGLGESYQPGSDELAVFEQLFADTNGDLRLALIGLIVSIGASVWSIWA